ncbi:cell wall-binding repeat-containing protein [Candidatus Clostridium radicumherbarum]|uniref:Cell wall-binding repeat-containing protein n=1 Tax=Candidatus Clostridium radicumherbarum TaxID=3381662 RepID=A0ABW8TUM7_9CLOT
MFSKRFNKLIAISTIAAVLISSPIIGQAATISDTYMKGISVGFTSMGSITTLDFTLTGDYIIDGQGIIINGNNSYCIRLENSALNLYKNGVLFYSTNSDITIKPLNTDTFIKFNKKYNNQIYMRQFAGNMTFKNNGTCFIPINNLKMEDYVKGVVPYEEGDTFPSEALKAQAIASRTWAIKNSGKYISQGFNVSDDTNSQVYNGYSPSSTKSNQAVTDTNGKVLTYNGGIIDALYSSSNGGWTEPYTGYPYLPSQTQDTYDVRNVVTYTPADILKLIQNNDKYKNLNAVQFKSMDIVNVAGKQNVNTLNITYNNGTNDAILVLDINDATNNPKSFFNLLSNWFTAKQQNDGSFVFNVRYGHGMGMSQWGAFSRANAGLNYDSILKFYFCNIDYLNANASGTIINGAPTRLGGQNRYETSVQIAENMYSGKINNVVLATGADFPDALSGSVLAKAVSAPILLVDAKPTSAGSSPALNYIASHLNQGGNVYLLGGEGVISKDFEAKLTSMGYNFRRLGGTNRFDTNTQIVNQLNALNAASSTGLVIATANDFPDALSISPAAALNGWSILLSNKDSLTPDEEKYISSMKPDKVYIAGGNGVVSDNVLNKVKTMLGYGDDKVIRLGGSNRYETSKKINSALFNTPNRIGIATGQQFADALSGSVYAALYRAPIVLADPNQVTEAQNYIKFAASNANSIDATVFGQTGAVSDTVLKSLTGVTN